MSGGSRLKRLEEEELQEGSPVSLQTLLDLLVCVFEELRISPIAQESHVASFLQWAEPLARQVKQLRLQREDFEILKVIGRGNFSEVAIAKMRRTQRVYAMKIMNKWDMVKRGEIARFQEEREVMVRGDRRWITELHYAFQDDNNLYLVMDYYVGGDLLTLLSKFGDRIPEEMSQFYLAEMVMAVDSIHRLGYVHRDIKPDNILLDAQGHIRLGDFGSCLKLREDGMIRSSVAVGTPDYLSPEILHAVEDSSRCYGPECDWWSLGICAFEMFFGQTPFFADSIAETYAKIINFQEHFVFPRSVPEISEEARDLIGGLVCGRQQRLGRCGFEDFKGHPFFAGINWDKLRHCQPPFQPEVLNSTDTSNFDVVDDCLSDVESLSEVLEDVPLGVHLAFVGYSYTATKETGAVDRSNDIMVEISREQLSEEQDLLFQETLSQVWMPAELPPCLELPLEPEEASAEPDSCQEEAFISRTIIGNLESRLRDAERRNWELEEEIERLNLEIKTLKSAQEKELRTLQSLHSLPACSLDHTWDTLRADWRASQSTFRHGTENWRQGTWVTWLGHQKHRTVTGWVQQQSSVAPSLCKYPLVVPIHRHLLLFSRMRRPNARSEGYLLLCTAGWAFSSGACCSLIELS
ncbi:myotonin-protein kinase-like isoform X2 [Polyodon spathula]|uniref:myotonin-protein kinase-like isoform X2 n=1 Tax=Polyodon spathula TaxID=7913 RepID=UPI001B7E0CA7|nr:myotonin-protein kinase-like isoform X2 [Polyodon spathula]